MHKKIYLDNAATTPLTQSVKEVMHDAINNLFGNPSSIHHFGRISRAKIEASRKTIANLLNVSVGEIFFSSSATESTNHLITKSTQDLGIKRIITSPDAHPCILNSAEELSKSTNVKMSLVKINHRGQVDLLDLEKLLSSENSSTLVTLMLANNEIGTINDFDKISIICKKFNALLHCDAVQYLGKRKLDLEKMQVSFLTGSGHKFHGPKGIGFLYMNNKNIISPFIRGGSQERNVRGGTENLFGIIAMSTALRDAHNHMEERINVHKKLKYHMIHRIQTEFENVLINGYDNPEKSMDHILNVSFALSEKSKMLLFNLDISGISASSGSACSAGIPKDSHVLESIGHPKDRVAIRFSFSHLNSIEEINYTIKVLKENLD
jgi:cysteine desulfurase